MQKRKVRKKNYQHLEDLGSNRDLECDHDVKVGPKAFLSQSALSVL